MFVGHIGVGLAAKRWAPSVGLAWLVGAVIAVDLVWPIFVLLGVEELRIMEGHTAFNALVFESYPWSHSLLMGGVWGAALAGLARWRGIGGRAALLVGALVVSHWLLDVVSHVPDLPLWHGSARLGLGLWNSIPGTLLVEGAIWVVGIALYLRHRPPAGRLARWAFWSFVVVSTVLWVSSVGSVPPSAEAVAWFGLVGWITIPWVWLADRNGSGSRRPPEDRRPAQDRRPAAGEE